MKKFLFVFMAFLAPLCAEDDTEFRRTTPKFSRSLFHLSAGTGPYPLPIPVLGMGYRKQVGHQGGDLSLRVSSIVYLTQVKLVPSYLLYFNPSEHGQIYMGIGAGGNLFIQSWKKDDPTVLALSPELIAGKEYIGKTGSKRFLQ